MTKKQKLQWDFNWKLSLAVLIFLPLLVRLGFWQLERAEEKARIKAHWVAQQSLPAIEVQLSSVEKDIHQYRRVRVQGHFLPEKFWLQENQIIDGRLGYHVIMPFRANDGTLIAVDRGWVLGSPLRDFVPEIITPKDDIWLSGSLMIPSDSKLIREADVSVKGWPHKILEVDLAVLSKQLEMKLLTQLLRLEEGSPGALEVFWQPINISPQKHIGYAVQWFVMAGALIILFIFASSNLAHWLKYRSDSDADA